jgi:hypothetical protein
MLNQIEYIILQFLKKKSIVALPTIPDILKYVEVFCSSRKFAKYTFIDFGCGQGEIIEKIHPHVLNVEGIEIEKDVAEIATNRFTHISNIKIINKDMCEHKFKDVPTILYIYEPLWMVKDQRIIDKVWTTVVDNLLKNVNKTVYIIYVARMCGQQLNTNYLLENNFRLIKMNFINRGLPFINNKIMVFKKSSS